MNRCADMRLSRKHTVTFKQPVRVYCVSTCTRVPSGAGIPEASFAPETIGGGGGVR